MVYSFRYRWYIPSDEGGRLIRPQEVSRVDVLTPIVTVDGTELVPDALCDGGSEGCGGGLLIQILQQIKTLHSGQLLEIRSTDAGVREDLPAWCRMTGHDLLAAEQGALRNRYLVRKA